MLGRKLAGEASAAEIAELETLYEAHPAYESICRETETFWQTTPETDKDFLEATYLVHLLRLEEKGHPIVQAGTDGAERTEASAVRPKRKLRWLLLPALAVIALLAFWLPGRNSNEQALARQSAPQTGISTKNGSHSKIQLPDGSEVWLNAGSNIHYDKSFGVTTREVYLDGEAFFDVVRNPEKPFLVHTNSMNLRVLGTRFNVRCYAGDRTAEASLIHGSLEVTENKHGEKWILKPNEKIVVFNTPLAVANQPVTQSYTRPVPPAPVLKPLTYHTNDTLAIEAAWTQNRLSFKDESFADVARKMERWFDAEFVFRDESKKALMMYGSFTTESLEQALTALEFSFDFRYKVEKRKVFIY